MMRHNLNECNPTKLARNKSLVSLKLNIQCFLGVLFASTNNTIIIIKKKQKRVWLGLILRKFRKFKIFGFIKFNILILIKFNPSFGRFTRPNHFFMYKQVTR
jgi:hypothetical protein